MDKSYHGGRRLTMRETFRKTGFFGKMAARPFCPVAGEVYDNRNGQSYLCLRVLSDQAAEMENLQSGWRFIAHRFYVWPDGYIEWGCSTSGRFVK